MMMAAGVPSLFHMQRIFWAFVGTAIATATIANVLNRILYYQRIRTSKKIRDAARPKSYFFKSHATISAVIREYGYYSLPLSIRNIHFYLPPLGPMTMMVGYAVLIVVCCLYRLNPNDLLSFEDIGYRAGFIAVCQIPLIVLLAGKRNIIGALTGLGYERLNWLHRWTARALLLTVLIHCGFWLSEWGKFDYIMVKIKTDSLTQKGIAAGSILLWLVVSSVAPIRGLCYEIFVVQHIISWLGFFVALSFHVPAENQIWLWLPLGFWAFDRLVRAVFLFANNISLFHKSQSGFLACKATFEPLDESHTRIIIANPPVTWQAGQHLFLACHPLAPLSSHPFTISSLPSDGRIEFVVRAKKGATKRFFKYAEKIHPALPTSSTNQTVGRSVLVDGPYSRIRPLRQFDSLVFVAGSTGATFTVPLMRDIVQHWAGSAPSSKSPFSPPIGAVTHYIRFIWVIKRKSSICWFGKQLDQVVEDVEILRNEGHDIAVDISIYLTCDDTITSGQSSIKDGIPSAIARAQLSQRSSFSSSDKKTEKETETTIQEVSSSNSTAEECCCTRIVDDEDAISSPCNCASKSLPSGSCAAPLTTTLSSESQNKSRIIDDRISLVSGRPNVKNIIRKTAELALGEMAVVVCGPPGLVQCTRNAAVAVSDDRAVHKGTGAQGIYVHAETFGYA